jgi:hypothetical protein
MNEQPWTWRTRDGDPGRVATILPGQGYTSEAPLLSYAGAALAGAGWTVRSFVWSRPSRGRGEATEVYSRVVRDAVEKAPSAHHLLIGKSLGTLVLPLAVELRLPGAWLTPLISASGTAEVRAAATTLADDGAPPALLVGGTADELWDGGVAKASGADVVEVPGANHSMEIPGDWRRSLEILGEVTAAVERLASGLGR